MAHLGFDGFDHWGQVAVSAAAGEYRHGTPRMATEPGPRTAEGPGLADQPRRQPS
ncbi:hypothetical protein [Streptomyces sp. R41]|uniref:Uncharacterized protein n=1 Tax=Streptomyces sp. R41 TaxID=3238632 RepID=A0AB39RKZ1_9ACTN